MGDNLPTVDMNIILNQLPSFTQHFWLLKCRGKGRLFILDVGIYGKNLETLKMSLDVKGRLHRTCNRVPFDMDVNMARPVLSQYIICSSLECLSSYPLSSYPI